VRDFKTQLSSKLLGDLLVITDRGKPVSVNLPYSDVLELIDILDELTDPETLAMIAEGIPFNSTGFRLGTGSESGTIEYSTI
jgi:hypothetical protein